MSKLKVTIDYMKVAQWFNLITYYERKIKDELDKAAIDARTEEQTNQGEQ